MTRPTNRHVWCLLVAALTPPPADAQTGSSLAVRPWPQQTQAQLHIDVMAQNRGRTDNDAARFRLRRYDVSGRWRESTQEGALAVGFDGSYLSLSTNDHTLPSRLIDQSVAGAFALGETDQLGFVVGLGYAGNNPYADAEALYGQASLVYTQPIDDRSKLQMIMDFDGHRVLFPDLPLPSLIYHQQVDQTLGYAVGFPVNSIHWRPSDRLSIHLIYIVPITINATIEYEPANGWIVFGRIDNRLDAFTIDGAQDHRRLFFRERRVEVGFQLQSDQNVNVTLAGGYAFSREFSTGFDVRDLDDVADVSDEPYFRVAVALRF